MEPYGLMQMEINKYYRAGAIRAVTIRRQSRREWIPIFEIIDKELSNEPIHCTIRVRTKSKIRVWADPRALVEFLMDQYGLEECYLIFPSSKEDRGYV